MSVTTIISIVQILVSIILIALVMVQGGGAGLSSSFSGFGNYYSTKRGFDRYLFLATIFFGFLFCAISLLVIIKK